MGVKNDVEAGELCSFTILAHGADGAPKSRGGDAFAVTITGSDPRTVARRPRMLEVEDMESGRYVVRYVLEVAGAYRCFVQLSRAQCQVRP
jgi:hypothetical protein